MSIDSVPIALNTFNRPDYFAHILPRIAEHKDKVIIFEDASTDPEKIKLVDEAIADGWNVHRWETRDTHPHRFIHIGRYFTQKKVPYYMFIEDDIVMSKNWYQYGMAKLNQLLDANLSVGVFALYSGDPYHLPSEVMKHVRQHKKGQPFYGSCSMIINTAIVENIADGISRLATNPDIAINNHDTYFPGYNLYVLNPTVVEHIGSDDTLTKASPHSAGACFLGESKDAMELL